MQMLKLPLLFLIVSAITACTSSTPAVVTALNNLQIPVTQSTASGNKIDNVKMEELYQDNEKIINELSWLLKKRYLRDSHIKDIFDTQSNSHQIYASLTKLEIAGMVNKQYLRDNNLKGLYELHEKMAPYKAKFLNRDPA